MKFFNEPHLQEDHATKEQQTFVFRKDNYKWMFVGIGFIVLGYLLMAGGGSDDPNVFNPDIYSWRRIRLAPALVLIGLGFQIYAILYKPKGKKEDFESTNAPKHNKGNRK